MKKLNLIGASAAVMMCAAGALAAGANAWIEGPGDAGDLPGTSQDTVGVDPLQYILGNLGNDGYDVDMFRIKITNVAQFIAQVTTGGSEGRGNSLSDSQLWLFDCDGRGVTADDDSGGSGQARITGLNVPHPGIYYLAISSYNIDAFDALDRDLWDSTGNNGDVKPDFDTPLAYWAEDEEAPSPGFYEITLRGAGFSNGENCCDCVPLPTAGLMGLAGLGAAGMIRRRNA